MSAIALDELGQLALAKYNADVTAYNEQIAKIKAVSSIDEFTAQFLATAPELAEENAKIEKLEAALEDLLGKRLVKATPLITPAYEEAVKGTGVDTTALDELKKKVSLTARYITSVYGDEALADSPKVEKIKGGSTGTNAGAGGRRIRGFDVYVDGVLAGTKNAEGVVKSSFAAGAKAVKCETSDLQRAFFEAAGSEDYKDDEFPSVVEFAFNEHKVRAVKVGDSSDDDE